MLEILKNYYIFHDTKKKKREWKLILVKWRKKKLKNYDS